MIPKIQMILSIEAAPMDAEPLAARTVDPSDHGRRGDHLTFDANEVEGLRNLALRAAGLGLAHPLLRDGVGGLPCAWTSTLSRSPSPPR
jgi:hypothetical protein